MESETVSTVTLGTPVGLSCMEYIPPLPHAVYFEALDQLGDDMHPDWQPLTAGLVVLRLVDEWLIGGPHVATTDVTARHAVREAVTAIPEGHVARSILLGIVDTILEAEEADIGLLASRLMAYGTSLVYESRWTLAVDVFDMLHDWTHNQAQHMDITLDTLLNIASAYRHVENRAEAAEHYMLLRHQARRAGDASKYFLADIGLALLTTNRGDLPGAEAQFQEILTEAEAKLRQTADTELQAKLQNVCAMALQNMGYVALRREHHERAIRYNYRALRLTTDQRTHDRLLVGIANGFLHLGSWQVAQETLLILVVTAQERYIQTGALVDLLYIAALAGNNQDFDRYRHELKAADMPPALKVYFYTRLGQGHARLGNLLDAETALQLSIALAEKHQLNDALFTAEKALSEINNHSQTLTTSSTPVPSEVQDVAVAMADMYALAYAKI